MRLWELVYNKAGEFEKLKHAMTLTGHKASIYDLDYFPDATKVLTSSKDGTWKIWKIHGQILILMEPFFKFFFS